MNKREILKKAQQDPEYRKKMIRKLARMGRVVSSHHLDTDYLLWDGSWGRNRSYVDLDDDTQWMAEMKRTRDDYYELRMSYHPLDLSSIYFTRKEDLLAFLVKLQKNLTHTIAKAKTIKVD